MRIAHMPKPTTRSAQRTASSVAASLGMALISALGLIGCGTATGPQIPTSATKGNSSVHAFTGTVHGGAQAITGAKIYLYAVNTTSTAGPAMSLLNTPGYVLTGTGGSFSISTDYSCPSGAYVYLLALGGNPGLAVGTNNSRIALVSGLGLCSSLSSSTVVALNEVTTVAAAYALSGYATSETNIGASGATTLAPAFGQISTLVNAANGQALPNPSPSSSSGGTSTTNAVQVNSLANSLTACVNTDGTGSACSKLMSDAQVTTPVDTFQAALNIAQNPNNAVADIYNLGAASSPYQPSLSTAPASWASPITPISPTATYMGPSFFSGQVPLANGVYYLAFPNGNYFGYYSYLTDPHYIYHIDLGYEYIADAGDAEGGIYMFDFTSGHTWYTSISYPFPYIYDSTLNAVLYIYPDPNNAGHYGTNGTRYFYNFATGQIITM